MFKQTIMSFVLLQQFGCDLDRTYETSRFNNGDMFEQIITSFVPYQLFGSKWLPNEAVVQCVLLYTSVLNHRYETSEFNMNMFLNRQSSHYSLKISYIFILYFFSNSNYYISQIL